MQAYLVRLLENHTTLAVTQDRPVDLSILQLLDTDFTGEGTIGLVEHVLGRDTQLLVGKLAGEGQVQRGRRDDDLRVGVKVGGVEVVDDGGDTVRNTVPVENWSILGFLECDNAQEAAMEGFTAGQSIVHLEVTTDEELARHDGQDREYGTTLDRNNIESESEKR